MRKVWYLAYYNTPASKQVRSSATAAHLKVEYVARAIREAGCDVQIISAAHATHDACPAAKVKNKDGIDTHFLFSARRHRGWLGKMSTFFFHRRLFSYLCRTVGTEDVLLVYHSLATMRMVRSLQKRTGCRLVLEVEELYGDVLRQKRTMTRERKYVAHADGYIFSTILLQSVCNPGGKPSAVVNGVYETHPVRGVSFPDDRIHVVYTGTFEFAKLGTARDVMLQTAALLPSNYHIHILGFGSSEDVQYVCRRIREIATKSACLITYEGCLLGDEYISFLSKCHIGLSPQPMTGAFTSTSFPSKVFSYLSCGLQVVAAPVAAVTSSALADMLVMDSFEDSMHLAKTILSMGKSRDADLASRMSSMHATFVEALKNIFGGEDICRPLL